MRTLYLHIGAPKTGSTYIQTSLRLSREALAQKGIFYPIGTEAPALEENSWTSGNGTGLFLSKQKTSHIIKEALKQQPHGVFISSEGLPIELAQPAARQNLQRMFRALDCRSLKVLVFLRNPVEHMVSLWLEYVKTFGYTGDLDAFVRSDYNNNTVKEAIELVEHLSSEYDCQTSAWNYNICKSQLLNKTADWLGLEHNTIHVPEIGITNRSLDIGEARLLQELNAILGKSAPFLSKALTRGLPGIRTRMPVPGIALQELIWVFSQPWVEKANRMLPKGHELIFDRKEPTDDTETYQFTGDQLRVIAESLGGEIKKIWDKETLVMKTIRKVMAQWSSLN